jgi:hypothetical protein
VNCSEAADAHPQQFEYLQIPALKGVKLMEAIQFVNGAIEERGKVLVSYQGRNSELAVGLVLAYLIEQHRLTYFEVLFIIFYFLLLLFIIYYLLSFLFVYSPNTTKSCERLPTRLA